MRVALALALLRAEKRALESRIDALRFDVALSRRLDALVIAIEALASLAREERAA